MQFTKKIVRDTQLRAYQRHAASFLASEDGFFTGFGSIVGGLIGSRSAKKAPARQRFFDKVSKESFGMEARKSATNSGFNPLTMLQALSGGAGGYNGPSGGSLASTELLAGGIADAIDSLTGNDKQEKARLEKEKDLLKIENDKLRSGVSTAGANALKPRPIALTNVSGRTPEGQKWQMPQPYTEGEPAYDSAGNPHTPAISVGAGVVRTNPNFSDAEIYEQRYGEFLGPLFGPVNLVADVAQTFNDNKEDVKKGLDLLKDEATEQVGKAKDVLSQKLRDALSPVVNFNHKKTQPKFGQGNRKQRRNSK